MLYLLRHAESRTVPGRPEAEWPLTDAGRQQAQALANRLSRVDTAYSSPYRRAVETVRPLAATRGLPLRTDDRLRERELTDRWLDDHRQALRRAWADFNRVLPGGESSAECQRRVTDAIRDVQARHGRDERILVCSHGNAIGLFLHRLDEQFGFADWQEMENPDLFAVYQGRWKRLDLSPIQV